MSNEEQKSYNLVGVDDMEYVEELGLDPALAYTPEINQAIIDKVAATNREYFEGQGLSPAETESKVQEAMSKAKERVSQATKSRGY